MLLPPVEPGLVATDKHGVLPNNIVRKPGDANRLDGLDSTSFVQRVARRGEVLTGQFGAWGGGQDSYVEDNQTFAKRLPVSIPETRITFLESSDPFTAECPARGTVVPNGWLCIYEVLGGATSGMHNYDPLTADNPTSTTGFGVWGNCEAASCFSYGSLAVRAGSADDVALRTTTRRSVQGDNP